MQVIRKKAELRVAVNALKAIGKTIGFVPTMGALHDGHISLVDIAKRNSDAVVSSIFVNPAQFAPHEDFDKYPRQEQADLAKLKDAGVAIAYLPDRTEIYQQGFSTAISVGSIGQILEGVSRPHFFDGVCLVVTKLFMQAMPDIAVFGEKDYQQLTVIKKLVRELDMPVKVIGAPICRESDGLAMSSRNVYLPAKERELSANLYRTLQAVKDKLILDENIGQALSWGKNQLIEKGFESVDYLELRDAETLEALTDIVKPARLLATVRIAGVRLLDNIAIIL